MTHSVVVRKNNVLRPGLVLLRLLIVLIFAAGYPNAVAAPVSLTNEEREWLDQNPEILTLYYDATFPPVEFISDSGTFSGIGADIIERIEQLLGIQFVKKPSYNWNHHLEALKSGACAVAPTIVKTSDREVYAFFTQAYIVVPVVLIASKMDSVVITLKDCAGKRVGVVSGYASEQYMRDQALLYRYSVVPVANVPEGLRLLSVGEIDCFAENIASAAYYIEKNGIPNLKVAGTTGCDFKLSIAVSRKYPLLFSSVQKALNMIPESELAEARKKWVTLDVRTGMRPETLLLIRLLAVFTGLTVLALTLITLILRYRLRQRVDELHRSESRYRRLAENSPAVVFQFVLHPDGTFSFPYISSGVKRLLDIDPKEVQADAAKLLKGIHPDDAARFYESVQHSAEQMEPYRAQLRYVRSDGVCLWAEVLSTPQRTEDNRVIWDGFFLDVTERKKNEDELVRYRDHLEELIGDRTAELIEARDKAEEGSRAKSVFLTKMSHELRTPLNAILGYAQIFLKKPMDEGMRQGLTIIQQSGEHLLTLINDILCLSKIEANKMELYPTPVELKPFLEGIIGIIRTRAAAKGLELRAEFPENLPGVIMADETRLRQVLLNLLSNAVKFTNEGFTVFRVSQSSWAGFGKARLRFEVEDSGIGISEEDLKRLFRPFEQISRGPRWMEGSGLGLAISRQLVQLMGGDITVSSKPDRGSVFAFELQVERLSAEKSVAAAPQDVQIAGYEGPVRRVLVVDDVESNRKVLLEMLEPLGFEIIEAADGRQAVEAAGREPPDLILTDLYMPGMDGFQAVLELRKNPALKNTVILAVSASVSQAEQASSIHRGFDDFLSKPVDWNRLTDVIGKRLKLQWRYADSMITPTPPAADQTAGMVLPGKEELARFEELLRMGDMDAVTRRARQLTEENTLYESFAEHVIRLAGGFQERELTQFIRNAQGNSSSPNSPSQEGPQPA